MALRRPFNVSSSSRKWAFFVLSLSFSALWWAAESVSDSDDVNALLALQQAWGAVSALQWTGDDPCGSGWRGIKCDSTSSPQRVTSIILSGLGLGGELPPDIGLLSGLVTLDMSSNSLNGPIPSQIGQLTQLVSLTLDSNSFNGQIPLEIGHLTNLTHLSLNGNSLTGGLPNEIGLLENLFMLDVGQNQLDGALPVSSNGKSGLDNLTKAGHLHLANNSFSGSIPASMCHSGMRLIELLLGSNSLVGEIPAELASCSGLTILRLNYNQLVGNIPASFANLTDLTELQLKNNGLQGPLPDLSNLINLRVLELSNNPQLIVELPSWMTSLGSLTDLNMENSSVSGQIPPSFFGSNVLNNVKLSNNNISGTLDLREAISGQLLLVSMENNGIVSLTPGTYSNLLWLKGNPVCNSTNYSAKAYCLDSSATITYQTNNTCSNAYSTCPSGYSVSPIQCSCAIPFQGKLIYRTPSFTSLSNTSRISIDLVTALAHTLSVDQKQVVVSASFNDQNQLSVSISIFPNGSATSWSPDDVLRMSIALGDDTTSSVSPPGFGPPLFRQSPYDFNLVDSNIATKKSGLSMAAKIGIGIGTALLLLVILAVGFFASLQKRRADKAVELSEPFGTWGQSTGKDSGAAPKLKGARLFSFSELKKATNNFSESNEVGSGGYGKIYRGIISSGERVAVKRAQANSMQGAPEFKNEIELLSRVHHKNVVSLIGFCFEQGEQMLVYEYMAGGSLRDCLLGRGGVRLDWRRRTMIALGAARGITYLHELVSPPIIHRDIKSTNILLDEKKIAKVGDFGLSKIGPGEGTGKQHVSTQVKGTLGYLDPEYYTSHQLTEKSDVYSYGVVLLELLTARPPIEHGKYVVKEVKTAIDKGGLGALRSMLDPRIRDEELFELNTFVHIALSCVEEAASSRPSMGEVVKQLEELIGQDYPESGSSNIDLGQGHPIHYPYGSDSDYLNTSREFSGPPFTNNSANATTSG